MARRLPNLSNNYNGHGRTTALPSSFYNDPKTVRRRMLRTGEEHSIPESQALFETGGREFRGGSWCPLRGIDAKQAMAEILDAGAIFVTLQAAYWKPEARARRQRRTQFNYRKAA